MGILGDAVKKVREHRYEAHDELVGNARKAIWEDGKNRRKMVEL